MKTKGLIFVSCLAAGALMAAPAMGKPAKKSSVSTSKRMAPQTTQMTRHNQNMSPRMGNTRYYGTRSYAGRQHTATRYYGGTRYYGNNYYGGVSRYSYGGGYPNYGYYSGSPYSNWGYGTSGYYPYSYYGGYPYSGYNNYYRTTAVLRTVVTTTTRTTRQPTGITAQRSQLSSSALADSATTTGTSTELLDRRPAAPSRLLKAEMACLWTGRLADHCSTVWG